MNDRFELEEAITDLFSINEELEILLYKIGDSPITPTEDEIQNMVIGIKELNKVRFERVTNGFESLVIKKVIK